MRVRMNTRLAGPGGNVEPGQEIDVDRSTGNVLVKCGYATEVTAERETPAVETAERKPPETAVGKAAHPKKKLRKKAGKKAARKEKRG